MLLKCSAAVHTIFTDWTQVTVAKHCITYLWILLFYSVGVVLFYFFFLFLLSACGRRLGAILFIGVGCTFFLCSPLFAFTIMVCTCEAAKMKLNHIKFLKWHCFCALLSLMWCATIFTRRFPLFSTTKEWEEKALLALSSVRIFISHSHTVERTNERANRVCTFLCAVRIKLMKNGTKRKVKKRNEIGGRWKILRHTT